MTQLWIVIVVTLVWALIRQRRADQRAPHLPDSVDRLAEPCPGSSVDPLQKAWEPELAEIVRQQCPDNPATQQYLYAQQLAARSWMTDAPDPEIRDWARDRYPNDYVMQRYTYDLQAEAKAFMADCDDQELFGFAVFHYHVDYAMQKFTYQQQAWAKRKMNLAADGPLKQQSIERFPENYLMQSRLLERSRLS